MVGLYIHVPFCSQRCIYCDFYSTTMGTDMRQQYTNALCKELESYAGETLSTIYLGGGTPSQLSEEQLSQLFDKIYFCFSITPNAEITIEVNPDDVTSAFVEKIKTLGVNRVSLGIQTFDDQRLHFLNRRHTSSEAKKAVQLIADKGIENISIDLIYGLPKQTLDEWCKDVEQALALPIVHLSSYSLMIEEGTILYRLLNKGAVKEVDEELELSMFKTLIQMTSEVGFEHYEISNFSRTGYRSRHNSNYWLGLPYIGCGPGAHSFDGNDRRWNASDVRAYVSSPGKPPHFVEKISAEEHYEELIFTRMRMCEGLPLVEMSAYQQSILLERAEPYLRSGMLKVNQGNLCLTEKGIFISDYIFSDLI